MFELNLSAKLLCPFDGVTRLVTDAERFGFSLRGMRVQTHEEGAVRAVLTLGSCADIDDEMIAHRFGRHPSILAVEVSRNQIDKQDR